MESHQVRRGVLTGRIYGRMLQFLEETGGEVRPVDVVRWWSFWESVVPTDINPGRFFWASLVATTRMRKDQDRLVALFQELEGWLLGEDYTTVEIVHLDDDPKPSQN